MAEQRPDGHDEQNPQREFWRKQPDESDHAYEAFATYRDLGYGRRLRKAASVFYDEEDTGATDSHYDQFKRWSSKFWWQSRVEAYDAEVTRRRALGNEQRRRELEDDTWRASRVGINAAIQRIYGWSRVPLDIPGGQVVPLLRESVQMARLSVGEATQRTERLRRTRTARSPTPAS